MKIYQVHKNKDLVIILLFTVLCVTLLFIPTGFENRMAKNSYRERAKVILTDNSDVHQYQIIKTGNQELYVEILSGDFNGNRVNAINRLQGKVEFDEFYTPGDIILLEVFAKDGHIRSARARGRYRIRIEVILVVSFAVLLILVGGLTGAKALLSFVFTALMLWKVMFPRFLNGDDPILVALGVMAVLTGAICFLVGGVNKKGLTAFLGGFLGLVLTCVLAQIFHKGFQIHGAGQPFAEMLLYSGFFKLSLTRIFIAGIFIACSGAVMDLAMDISASMHEIFKKHPGITLKEHILSGMSVGRAVIGTMTTTLLLAYSSSYMTMLMLFQSQGLPLINIFNINFVAAELLNTIVGSFGLVTVAPLTAVIGGLIYSRHKKTE